MKILKGAHANAIKAGYRDGKNAPQMVGEDTWKAFYTYVHATYPVHSAAYVKAFEIGYNS